MKNLIALTVIILFATTAYAQESILMTTPDEGKTDVNTKGKPITHECYMFKNGSLVHCMGDKVAPQKTDVALKNGTVITPTGEVKMKDGKSLKLENGQCVSMMGSVGDCEKMHSTKKNSTLDNTNQVKDE